MRFSADVRAAVIAKLGKGENVTTDVLLKICNVLACDIADITEIGRDAAAYFNSLLMGRTDESYTHLWVAPNSFKPQFLDCVDREIETAKRGEKAQITIKCNSITDKKIIEKLIDASQSGVVIALIVRGICCIKPRVPGYTDNITVSALSDVFGSILACIASEMVKPD